MKFGYGAADRDANGHVVVIKQVARYMEYMIIYDASRDIDRLF